MEANLVKAKKESKVLPEVWEWFWMENLWSPKWERLMIPREEAERPTTAETFILG